MAKRVKDNGKQPQHPAPRPSPRGGSDPMGLATFGGMVLLVMVSFMNWWGISGIQDELDERLGQIDSRIAKISDKVGKVAQQPARRGPDPNRVYKVKTSTSPSKGPLDAPVTIAEFSDFQ